MKSILYSIFITLFFWHCKEVKQNVQNISDIDSLKSTPLSRRDTSLKYIYITFDDGPLRGSEDIDDAVRNEQINVNVFVVGQHALSDSFRGFYKMYQNNPYIEIGNHSFSHAHEHYEKFYRNPSAVVTDFLRCQAALQISKKIARQPGRNQWRLNDTCINDVRSGSGSADSLYKDGFEVFGWDLEWQHDPKTGVPIQTVDDMVELIEKKLDEHKTVKPNHLVLLAHDEMFRNGWEESELKQLIDKLKAQGNYRFEHLSSYPE
ncbi:MAG TPA: polysaccharide deacetylase family protein [Chitinophagaceae bacterium]